MWWRGCQRDRSDGFLGWCGGGEIGGVFFFFFCGSCGGFLLVVVGVGFI